MEAPGSSLRYLSRWQMATDRQRGAKCAGSGRTRQFCYQRFTAQGSGRQLAAIRPLFRGIGSSKEVPQGKELPIAEGVRDDQGALWSNTCGASLPRAVVSLIKSLIEHRELDLDGLSKNLAQLAHPDDTVYARIALLPSDYCAPDALWFALPVGRGSDPRRWSGPR